MLSILFKNTINTFYNPFIVFLVSIYAPIASTNNLYLNAISIYAIIGLGYNLTANYY